VLSLLLERVRAGSETDVQSVAHVLAEAPRELVFDNVNFVADLLASSARFGPKIVATLDEALWASAVSGERWGQLGEPFAEDVRLRDEAASSRTHCPRQP
jgi:hypothetical protein